MIFWIKDLKLNKEKLNPYLLLSFSFFEKYILKRELGSPQELRKFRKIFQSTSLARHEGSCKNLEMSTDSS